MGLFSAIRTAIIGPDHTATFPGQTDEGDRAWREHSHAAEAAAKSTREVGRIRRERRARTHADLRECIK